MAKKSKPSRKTTTKKARSRKKATTKSTKKNATSSEEPPQKDAWRRVDRLQLAELIGVHPDTISDYTRSGMPVIKKGGAGRRSVYDAVECIAWWQEQQGRNLKEIAQTRAYEAQAELNELKIAQQRGDLLPREAVLLAGQSYTKAWTAKVRALPRQLVQAGVIPRKNEQVVTGILHGLLSEISRWESVDDLTSA